jgi:hypothetical protein
LEYLLGRARDKDFYVRELIDVLIREDLPDEVLVCGGRRTGKGAGRAVA